MSDTKGKALVVVAAKATTKRESCMVKEGMDAVLPYVLQRCLAVESKCQANGYERWSSGTG